MEQKKIRLDEVMLMRTILALLIVFMHSFTCYDGSWSQPVGYVDIPVYKWLARSSFAFTLEAFVFISGYLFAFQRIALKKTEKFPQMIVNKLKRLIIPSITFSLIYFLIFYPYKGFGNALYSIINGCGHMWYLPMLFWCFVLSWILQQIKINDRRIMFMLFVVNLLMFFSLPFRISDALVYLAYFYLGFLFYKYSDKIQVYITPRNLTIAWLVFIVCFVFLRPMRDILVTYGSQSLLLKLFIKIGNNACQIIYATTGLVAFYGTAVFYTRRHKLSNVTNKIAACSFGIYLFQQFVLQLVYYKTDFPLWIGPYWLPWCGFIIATVVSYILSNLLIKTKTGKFLIG